MESGFYEPPQKVRANIRDFPASTVLSNVIRYYMKVKGVVGGVRLGCITH